MLGELQNMLTAILDRVSDLEINTERLEHNQHSFNQCHGSLADRMQRLEEETKAAKATPHTPNQEELATESLVRVVQKIIDTYVPYTRRSDVRPKISMIKIVRSFTGSGLLEAKELVEKYYRGK